MKKYLSCIILVILCLVCAMVFYTNASSMDDDSTTLSPDIDKEQAKPTKVTTIEKSGTILSEYYSETNLRIEWSIYKYLNESLLYFSAEVYLDSAKGSNAPHNGYVEINGEKTDFRTESFTSGSYLIHSCTDTLQYERDLKIEINVHLDINIMDDNGVILSELNAYGIINTTEDYKNMDKTKLLNVAHVSQFPSLPTGDEITSLGTVLKFLNYNVDVNDLCDLYLSKGPVGFTSFYEANVGNPRSQYNSYGCYSPVIIDAAKRFIQANGGTSRVTDMKGYNPDELYRQVWKGNPIIVWVCEDFEITPSISRIWIVNGETLYLKSNMACMVLTGYDYTKNTVTLSNPAGGMMTVDMDLFELRYSQMGSQAIMIQ